MQTLTHEERVKTAEVVAQKLLEKAEAAAQNTLISASEEAKQILYDANLDVNKVNLICNKIVKIQSDLVWTKYLLGAIGTLLLYIIFK